jgi:hypothetical protein
MNTIYDQVKASETPDIEEESESHSVEYSGDWARLGERQMG